MKIYSYELLSELKNITLDNIQFVESIVQTSETQLNYRLSNNSWSILECIEHLNRYGDFYITEIDDSISASDTSLSSVFNTGFLGNYFVKSMIHKKKMKTNIKMNPIHSNLEKDVLKEFLKQQQFLLVLLEKAKHINLGKTKTRVSIFRFIKLRLGDTFRFVIYHNQRHIEQAKEVLIK